MKPRVLCLGAGGHASVVIDLLQRLSERGQAEPVGIIAPEGERDVLGVPVLGSDDDLECVATQTEADHFIVGIGATRAAGTLRTRLFDRGVEAGLRPFAAIHPSAVVAASAVIEPGAVVMAGAVVQARARICVNAIVNTRAAIDHDCIVGAHAHVAPGVTCSGGVTIGAGAHLGTGAVVIENVAIGPGATVGAGSVVLSDCAAGVTVVGVPARPKTKKR